MLRLQCIQSMIYLLVKGCFLLVILVACNPNPGRVRVNYPNDFEFVLAYVHESRWQWGVEQFELLGSYAVLASPELTIVDFEDLNSPSQLGTYDAGWKHVSDMVIQENRVFLASRIHGLDVVDIADVTNPKRAGFFEHQNQYSTNVVVVDDYAYYYAPQNSVAEISSNLPTWYGPEPRWYILDLSKPDNIQPVKELSNLAQPMAISGDYIYTADLWHNEQDRIVSKFQIIDVTDRLNPMVVSELYLENGWVADIVVINDTAYVSVGSGLRIIDVSDPGLPNIIKEDLDRIGSFSNIDVEDNVLVGDFVFAINIEVNDVEVDVEPLARLDLDKLDAFFCDQKLSYKYESDKVRNIYCPTNFRNEGSNDIALKNGYVYVATEDTGLVVFKVPN